MEHLSELEGVVIGMLWSMGPKTAYSIRQFFLKSASPHWASSAGTIYPLVQRLGKRGFIRSERHATGRREGLMYTVAPAGMKALRRWIGPVPPAVATAVPVDSLRLRIRYMGALPERQRAALLRNSRQELKRSLKRLEKDLATKRHDPDHGIYLAYRGAILGTRARLALVDEAEKVFTSAKRKR